MRTEQEEQAEEAIKQAICEAAWHGRVNQEYTSEVAARFGCSTYVAFDVLMDIVCGASGDERFKPDDEKGGVLVANGATFVHSDLGGNSHNSRRDVGHLNEYVWFLT